MFLEVGAGVSLQATLLPAAMLMSCNSPKHCEAEVGLRPNPKLQSYPLWHEPFANRRSSSVCSGRLRCCGVYLIWLMRSAACLIYCRFCSAVPDAALFIAVALRDFNSSDPSCSKVTRYFEALCGNVARCSSMPRQPCSMRRRANSSQYIGSESIVKYSHFFTSKVYITPTPVLTIRAPI